MPTKLNNKVSTDVEEVTDGEDSFLMWMTAFFLTVPHHEKLKILELKTMVFWNVTSRIMMETDRLYVQLL